MKKQITTALLALSLMCLSANCYANAEPLKQPKNPPQKMQKQRISEEQMKKMMEKRAEEFNKALGLTEEQIQKCKEIRKKGHEAMKPLMEKKKAKLAEIRAVMENEEMTVKAQDKKLEQLRAHLKEIDQDIRQLRRDNEKEFKSILSEEQKVKYAEIKQQGREHFKQFKKPQGPENFHRPMPHHEH